MALSPSGEIIGRLLASGMSGAQIARELGGINRSTISQVGRGAKPGTNLTDALRVIESNRATPAQAQPVPAPARRTTAAGTPAAVRRTVSNPRGTYSTTAVKRGAARNGARSITRGTLRTAAGHGQNVAVTASFDKGVRVNSTSGGKRGHVGQGGSVEINLGNAAQVAADVAQNYAGDFSAYVAQAMLDAGHLSGVSDAAGAVAHMTGLEARGY